MMQAPHTYAAWSDCLSRLESGGADAEILAAMAAGTLAWQGGVATLFAERISQVFSTRLGAAADRLQRDLASGGDETALVRALLDGRRTLCLLHQVANLAVFPERLRTHLSGEIRRYAERAQQSLECSARQDRSGRLASLLRHNPLTHYAEAPPAAADAGAPGVPIVPAAGRGRRILL
jgi:hypothetical protein